MRKRMLVLACAVWALAGVATARQGEKTAVRELDVQGVNLGIKRGPVTMPTKIATAEELAKAFPDKAVQARIMKEVDFGKQQLVLFAWEGSGGDKLTPQARGNEVVFQHQPGLTDDLRQHTRLFALPRDTAWRVQGGR